MFTPLGLFKDISCPEGQGCPLLACMFSHGSATTLTDHPTVPQELHIERQTAAKLAESAPNKVKLGAAAEDDEKASKFQPSQSPKVRNDSHEPRIGSQAAKQPRLLEHDARKPQPVTRESTSTLGKGAKRDIPPSKQSESRLPPRKAPNERLNPRMLTKAPASHGVRLAILTKLHTAMLSLNNQMAKNKENTDKSLVLTPSELITMALDEEEKTAKDKASIYSNVIKLRIVKLSKLSKDDWATEVKTYLNQKYYKMEAEADPVQQESKAFTTELSVEEELIIGERLVTSLEGLEQYGYVTKAPTSEEVETARKGVIESKGWEKCERCGGRFQVFPGRREDGSLTTGGPCTHHPGKSFYPPRKKTDHITGSREAYFSCCNETLGTSPGCTKVETHVFKVSETKRLASILQFEKTPENPSKEPKLPVCFDCEMGYTTLGLELIRLTAVSWPEGRKLLDVLVRPMGEVLDLNSRFSGVFPEHYTKAVHYSTSQEISAGSSAAQTEGMALQVVDSPAAARTLLFNLLQPTTPLIGHAIDNDLNVCRIIHPTIIDTAILYPHPRGGLPYRMGLRTLAKKHLDRDIQTGGNRGHDSKEDAIATGDLVRVKAAESWRILKSHGWLIQNGELQAPRGYTGPSLPAALKLGPGAGQKRASSNIEN